MPCGIEDHAEEWFAVVALQVGAIRWPHHRVAEAIRGTLEFDRHQHAFVFIRAIEARSAAQNIAHHRLADERRQNFVHDDPLVMPRRELSRARKHRAGIGFAAGANEIDGAIVKQQKRRVQPGEDDVLVVARVGDERAPVLQARQIFE